MLQLLIRVDDWGAVGTSRGDDSSIGKILAITDHRKFNVISHY